MPIFSGFSNLSALLPFDQKVLYPLSNTAIDPTSQYWRANNPNYTWIPNVGISVPQPLTDVSFMFAGNSTFNDPDVNLWNASTFVNLSSMFSQCSSFNRPLDSWLPSSATNMSSMFRQTSFNQNINSWNVSKVANFSNMFYGTPFNQPLNNWVTTSANNLSGMFRQSSFNQNINSWNVSKVITLSEMFYQNAVFNQALDTWDTSLVTDFSYLFYQARAFNQNIGPWKVGRAQTFAHMFNGATSFNCGQSSIIPHELMNREGKLGWQVVNVLYMEGMFNQASSFNGDIYGWCVSAIPSAPANFFTGTSPDWTVYRRPQWGNCPTFYPLFNSTEDPTWRNWRNANPNYVFLPNRGLLTLNPIQNAAYMFYYQSFNDTSLADWDTSSFTTTEGMFQNSSFVGPLSDWNMSNVTNMSYMFNNTSFDQPIGNWDTSKVTNMKWMFAGSVFNQDISRWNVSKVTVFWGMFQRATSFNCGLPSGQQHTRMQRTANSGWRTNSGVDLYNMFYNANSFAGNINQWCTSASADGPNPPGSFSYGTQMPNSFVPTWGTCPIP